MNRPDKSPVFLKGLGLITYCLLCYLSRFNIPGTLHGALYFFKIRVQFKTLLLIKEFLSLTKCFQLQGIFKTISKNFTALKRERNYSRISTGF